MLSGEDQNSNGSETEVPEGVENDTEVLGPKRGFVSVISRFFGFKKSLKQQFSINVVELTL